MGLVVGCAHSRSVYRVYRVSCTRMVILLLGSMCSWDLGFRQFVIWDVRTQEGDAETNNGLG